MNYVSAAVFPQLVAYFTLGISNFHCSLFSAICRRRFIALAILYPFFMLVEENCFSSTMVKCLQNGCKKYLELEEIAVLLDFLGGMCKSKFRPICTWRTATERG